MYIFCDAEKSDQNVHHKCDHIFLIFKKQKMLFFTSLNLQNRSDFSVHFCFHFKRIKRHKTFTFWYCWLLNEKLSQCAKQFLIVKLFSNTFSSFPKKIVWVKFWCKYSCLQVQTCTGQVYVSKCETFFVSFFPHGGGEFSSSTGFRVLLAA